MSTDKTTEREARGEPDVDATFERFRSDVRADIKRAVDVWWRWFVLPALCVGGALLVLQLIWLAW